MRAIRGKRIGMIFQDPFASLNPVMRIREQMREVLTAHALPDGEDPLVSALERVQLDPRRVLDFYPHQLSGGQRQRVVIATALLTHPNLILADEPTTALDALVQKDILELLNSLQKTLGFSMLLISHNLVLVGQNAVRIAVMKDGRLVEEGPSAQVLRQPHDAYTRRLIDSLPRMVKSGTRCWCTAARSTR